MILVSGLRMSTYGAEPARIATLFATLKPTFCAHSVSRTSGNSRRTISAVPSPEALSTTWTFISPAGGFSRSEVRQSRSSASQR